ncbi:MAG: virulence RhuM family protein [Neomegalonema sp.]|nr:virulence RhuM family protein [Neomegalonema sp.]
MSAQQIEDGFENLVFEGSDGGPSVAVRFEEDSVWMTQAQMAQVFEIGTNTVSDHLSKIFTSGELEKGATIRKIRIPRNEGGRVVARELNHYNLDAIIAVGYRVSSRRGTRFRQWATHVLRNRLQKDFERKNAQAGAQLTEMQHVLSLARDALVQAADDGRLDLSDEARGVIDVIDRYARSFTLLLQYDEDRLPDGSEGLQDGEQEEMVELTIEMARETVVEFKRSRAELGEDTPLLGQERGHGLEGVLGAIEQTFGGFPLYPTVAQRAANLLYFIVKDHPFSDGNKRLGSLLFLQYLAINDRLVRHDGRMLIEDNALVAIALLVAESNPAQRELVVRLILGLLDSGDEK